jgi:cytochrome c biogenesis protein ResB
VDFTSEVVNSSTPNAGSPAVKVKLYDGTEVESQWLTEGPQMGYKLATEELSFRLRAAKQKLPFSLTLEDFRKHDYPGTNQAAAYESDVTLTDDNVGLVKGAMISMNNPLDYKGYRIFQSSYAQNETSGEASIFTVSKNPGIPFIYLSSCFICGGTLYQFYGRKKGRGRKQEKSTRAT